MRKTIIGVALILSIISISSGCASWNRTQKGAVVGTAAGGGMGAVIGQASGNTALGTIIGAAVGGATGAVIGSQMDKQAEEIQSKVPDAKVERVGEGIVVEFNSNVLFGFDQSSLSADAKASLNKLVTVLEEYKETDIELQGHTDSRGAIAYNQRLSEERASAVSGYLAEEGVDVRRMTIKGYGESVPKYDNESAAGRTENRRVEFLITANAKMKAEAAEAAKRY